jgi:hypothetical protein
MATMGPPDGDYGDDTAEQAGSRVPFARLDLARYSPLAASLLKNAALCAGTRPSRVASTRSLFAALLAEGREERHPPNAAMWLAHACAKKRAELDAALARHYPSLAEHGFDQLAAHKHADPALYMTRDLAEALDDAESLATGHVGARHLVGSVLAKRGGEPSKAALLLQEAGIDAVALRADYLGALRGWHTKTGDDLDVWTHFLSGLPAQKALELGSDPDSAALPSPVASVSTLADLPLETDVDDSLEFGPCADALAGLIDDPKTGTPLTIAINAPWGAGKSTLAQMIARRLAAKPAVDAGLKPIVCWFNAWLHDDAQNLGSALASYVTRRIARERRLRTRLCHPLPRALWSPGQRSALYLSLTMVLIVTVAFAATRWAAIGEVFVALFGDSPVAKGVAGAGGLASLLGFAKASSSTAGAVAKFVADPDRVASFGNISEVRNQLERLVAQARRGSRRVVIFIDDLERCQPPRGVDLLEVVNQLLNHPGVVVVIIADMPAIAACADIKYEKLAQHYSPTEATTGGANRNYGRLYLHKIVQLQFDVPPHAPARLQKLLNRLARPSEPPVAGESMRPLGPWDTFVTTWKEYLPKLPLAALFGRIADFGELGRTALKIAALPKGVPLAEARAVRARVALVLYVVAAALGAVGAIAFIRYTIWGARTFTLFGAVSLAVFGVVGVQHLFARVSLWLNLTLMLLTLLAAFVGSYFWLGWALDVTLPAPNRHALVLHALLPAQLFFAFLPALLMPLTLWLGREEVLRISAAWVRRRIDTELASRGDVPAGELLPETRELLPAGAALLSPAELVALVNERRTLRLLDDQSVLTEAYAEVADYLARFPRSTKRFVNHVRVLVRIAGERGALSGNPALTPRHFGRWVLLKERWPALATALNRSPARMAELEGLTANARGGNRQRLTELRRLLRSWGAEAAEAGDIAAFCGHDRLKLGPVAERLVHLMPVH